MTTTRFDARRMRRVLLRYAVWSSGVVIFALAAAAIHSQIGRAWDAAVVRALAGARNPALNTWMRAVTLLGDGELLAVVTAAVVALLWWRRHWRSGMYLLIVSGGAGLLNAGLKALFARPRPALMLDASDGFAFPSGHSMGSAAVYGAIAIIVAARYPRWRATLIAASALLVLAIGLSRAYLGAHYPFDVVAGWALGVSWPLWLKPVILGPGYKAERIPEPDLEADHFSPEELISEERSRG